MQLIKGVVRNGRLVVDEATELPDGTEIELVAIGPIDEVAAEGLQGRAPVATVAWSAEIQRRIDEVEAGTVQLDDLDTVRARLEAASRP